MKLSNAHPQWTWALPIAGSAALVFIFKAGMLPYFPVLLGLILFGVVFAAVHHAEVIAHKTGEPFGTLILALSVTVIEVSLIVSMMLGSAGKEALARDTVFSAIMIICNGIVGVCLLLGGLKHREQGFHLKGASAAMSLLTVMAVVTLIFPNYAYGTPGPWISSRQLAFIAVVTLVLYGAFVFVQTVRHRDYFLVPGGGDEEDAIHPDPPSTKEALISTLLLLLSLTVVVGLAKALSPTIEWAVAAAGAPAAVVGVIIAAMVLLPEGLAAARAAQADKLQTSLNLALGSGLASIGLTIPTIAIIFVVMDQPLLLGLGAKDSMMLALTLLVGAQSLATGRTTILQGVIHLVLFASFLFFAVFP